MSDPSWPELLQKMDSRWRAPNYLTVGLLSEGQSAAHPQCEALKFVLDRFVLDSCGHARSKERLSPSQSLQATSLPALRVALAAHYENETKNRALVQTGRPLNVIHRNDRFTKLKRHGAVPCILFPIREHFRGACLDAQGRMK